MITEGSDAVGAVDDGPIGHLPHLDGLRAVSIFLVLGWHQMGVVSNSIASVFSGWFGVDIFFVLSGFLITSLLVQERERFGSFNLKNFYMRRVVRLMPAFYAFLLACVLLRVITWRSALFTAAHLTSWDWAFGWNLQTVCHMWSLAVEEQFYLVWPLLLRFTGRRALRVALCAVPAVWLWRNYLIWHGCEWQRIYGAFDSRLDCPMVGCIAALMWSDPGIRQRIRIGLSGKWVPLLVLAALAGSMQSLGAPAEAVASKLYVLWNIRQPMCSILAGTLILALLVHPKDLIVRVLSTPTLVWFGKLSYSMYLWHLAAYSLWAWIGIRMRVPGRVVQSPIWVEIGSYGLCMLLAATSYYLVERRGLLLKKRWEKGRQTPPAPDLPNLPELRPAA
jgi:peptidoglycan/LPS O-acetylase OafA/YrhL